MPDDLRAQIEPLLDAVQAMGLPLLRIAGVEADDVIGTLARRAAADGLDGADLHRRQGHGAAGGRAHHAGQHDEQHALDRAGVKAKFDVWPEQIIDYLALVGDSSDNIPGVDKVGTEDRGEVAERRTGRSTTCSRTRTRSTGKVGENLRAGSRHDWRCRASWRRSTRGLDLPLQLAQLARGRAGHRQRCASCTRGSNFAACCARSTATAAPLARRGRAAAGCRRCSCGPHRAPRAAAPTPPAGAAATTRIVLTRGAVRRLAASACSTPTWSPSTPRPPASITCRPHRRRLVRIDAGDAAYVPLAHTLCRRAGAARPRATCWRDCKPLLEDADARQARPSPQVRRARAAQPRHRAARHALRLDARVLRAGTASRRATTWIRLAQLVPRRRHDPVRGRRRQGREADRLRPGAGGDGRRTMRPKTPTSRCGCTRRCGRSSQAVPALATLYEELEQPLVAGAARDGAARRADRHATCCASRAGELATEPARARAAGARGRRPASSTWIRRSSCRQILFEKLQLPVKRKTPTGQPSTAEDVLEELADDYELPRADPRVPRPREAQVHVHRQAAGPGGSAHGSRAHQLSPGRGGHRPTVLDRPEPAEHPDPHAGRTPHPPGLHRAARARADGRGLFADRAAHHGAPLRRREPAARLRRGPRHPPGHGGGGVRHVAVQASRSDQRRSAKAINFGLIYGMSAFGLAKQLGIDRGAAQTLRRPLLPALPGREAVHGRARARRRTSRDYVETVFGRRLYLPDIRSRNRQLQQYAERSAINAPMQGTAADIIKRAMIDGARLARPLEAGARLVMQVHDELVLEVPEGLRRRGAIRTRTKDERSGEPARAAEGRDGHRRQLGRGALTVRGAGLKSDSFPLGIVDDCRVASARASMSLPG